MPDFTFPPDDDEELIRFRSLYQRWRLHQEPASSSLPASGSVTPSSHQPGQPLSSAASSRPAHTFASTLPAPLHASTSASISPARPLAHPEAAPSHQQHSSRPSIHLSSSVFPSGPTPLPGPQPTYNAIAERYQSPFLPQATQPPTQSFPSSSSTRLPPSLSSGIAPAPRFQARDTAPPLSTTVVNQARRASAYATLPQHQTVALAPRGRGRPPSTRAPALPRNERRGINMCQTLTGELNVMVKVYPPTVSTVIFYFRAFNDQQYDTGETQDQINHFCTAVQPVYFGSKTVQSCPSVYPSTDDNCFRPPSAGSCRSPARSISVSVWFT